MQTLSIWLGGKYSVTKKVVRLIFFLSKFQIKELFETALHKRTTQCALKQFEEEEEQFDMLTIHEAYQWLSRKYIDDDLAKNTGIYLGWMQIVTIFQKCKSIWRSVPLKNQSKKKDPKLGWEMKQKKSLHFFCSGQQKNYQTDHWRSQCQIWREWFGSYGGIQEK